MALDPSKPILIARFISRHLLLSRPRSISRFDSRCMNSGGQVPNTSEPLIRTSVLTQEGPTIHELPSIIQKTRDISLLFSTQENITNQHANPTKVSVKDTGSPKKSIHIETAEGTAILFSSQSDLFGSPEDDKNLDNQSCKSERRRVGPLIENMITEEINCRVALEALKEIMALESSDAYRRSRRSKSSKSDGSLTSRTNGRDRVFTQLTDMIAKTRDADMILEGLSLLQKDKLSLSKNHHRDRLCDEALIRATNGDFTLAQVIESVKVLSSYEDSSYRDVVDALWIGIKIREEDISEDNLSSLFIILPRFQTSREIVKMILEKKLLVNWWRLTGTQMAEILSVLQDNAFGSMTALTCARKWATLHINTANESELFDFLNSLVKVKCMETPVEKALAKYMGKKGLQTKDPAVVALIMNYCGNHRIRNLQILATCEEYLTKEAIDLPASLLAPLFVPFGYLNHQPSNVGNFWTTFETALAAKFSYLVPNDALNILLSMVYLERLPVNFVNEVFTPDFLDKLHSKRDCTTIEHLRGKLRLLDAAMAIECDRYICHMVPEVKSEKRVFIRARIKRVTNLIRRQLASVVGGEDKLSKSVILGQLPMIDLYNLDLLIHSSSVNDPIFRLNRTNDENIKTAVLIHLPEHYCQDTTNLIGPQEMRVRHLRKLGFRVMTLNYKMLLRLRLRNAEMRDYLIERLQVSQDV